MTQAQVIALIQQWIIANGNEEITANVLRPILEAMVNQPNDLIGDLNNLDTTYKDDLVGAINEVKSISSSGITIHYGSGTPQDTPPASTSLGDYYAQLDNTNVIGFWQFNGIEWVNIENGVTEIFSDYPTTSVMRASQSEQTEQKIYIVADASDDPNITFASGETRLQASYRFLGTENGSIDDYTLISAPYGKSETPTIEEVLDVGHIARNDQEFILGATEITSGLVKAFRTASKYASLYHDGVYLDNSVFHTTWSNRHVRTQEDGFNQILTIPVMEGEELNTLMEIRKMTKEISTSTYTLSSNDQFKVLLFTNTTGCVVTVPKDLMSNWLIRKTYNFIGIQMNTGLVSLVGPTGVTLYSNNNVFQTSGQYEAFKLEQTTLNQYVIFFNGNGSTSSGGAVDSVTGDGVDNTDPENPVLTFPTPAEINAQEELVSGTNIKTVNNESLLGTGNINITVGVQSVTGDGVDNTDPDNPVLIFPTEEEIIGGVESLGVLMGAVNIDLSEGSHFSFKTDGATITLTGLPNSGKTFTKTMKVNSGVQGSTLGFANSHSEYGEFIVDKTNIITILCIGSEAHVFFSQSNS